MTLNLAPSHLTPTAAAGVDGQPSPPTYAGALSFMRRPYTRDLSGVDGDIAEAFNEVVELNDRMTKEFERLGEIVGRQGKINHRARLPGSTGS